MGAVGRGRATTCQALGPRAAREAKRGRPRRDRYRYGCALLDAEKRWSKRSSRLVLRSNKEGLRAGLCSLAPLLRGPNIVQAQGRSNECEVRECLREIAKLPLSRQVVFLR